MNPSANMQTNQYGLNQQQQQKDGLLTQNSFNLGSQTNQLTDSNDLNIQTNQNFAVNPSFETTKHANNGIQQGFLMQQGSNGWQPSQTNEQRKTLGVFYV